MPVALTAGQRDTLHWAAAHALMSGGMVSDLFRQGEMEGAQLYRKQFEAACALLDDLGWEEVGARASYPVTMPEDQLRRLLLSLRDDAEEALGQAPPFFEQTRKWGGNEDAREEELAGMHKSADAFLDVRSTCNQVLKDLGEAE